MLLLVLILVLLAFALLVVALLSGSVLAAWVSVGLSIVAAVVLLVDWLQRRAAVKAGEASLLSNDVGVARAPEPPRAQYEPEPATEVLPVIPPAGAPSGQVEAGAVKTAAPSTPSTHDGGRDVFEAPDQMRGGSQNTVLIPPVQPPGSSPQPSGAEDGITSSSGSSSLSVTKSGSEAPSVDASGASPDLDQPTTFVETSKPDLAKPELPKPEPQKFEPQKFGSGADDAAGDPAGATADQPVPAGAVGVGAAAVAAAAAATATATATQDPAATSAPSTDEPATIARGGNSNLSGSDLFGGGANEAAQEPAAAEPAVQQQAPVQQAPAEQQVPIETDADGEPPEEHAAAEVVALVSGLEDDVIVIDEQPRYHVPGCRSLTAQTPIPIPAREAVELGFTPCGWCSPDRTLAERHPAAAR